MKAIGARTDADVTQQKSLGQHFHRVLTNGQQPEPEIMFLATAGTCERLGQPAAQLSDPKVIVNKLFCPQISQILADFSLEKFKPKHGNEKGFGR